MSLLCIMAPLASAWGQGKLVIAIQPTVASDEMLNKAKPLQQFLEKDLGGKTKVEIYVPSSYAAVVESLRFGHAHVKRSMLRIITHIGLCCRTRRTRTCSR